MPRKIGAYTENPRLQLLTFSSGKDVINGRLNSPSKQHSVAGNDCEMSLATQADTPRPQPGGPLSVPEPFILGKYDNKHCSFMSTCILKVEMQT